MLKKVLMPYTPVAPAESQMFSARMIGSVAPLYLPGLMVFKALVIFGLAAGYAQI